MRRFLIIPLLLLSTTLVAMIPKYWKVLVDTEEIMYSGENGTLIFLEQSYWSYRARDIIKDSSIIFYSTRVCKRVDDGIIFKEIKITGCKAGTCRELEDSDWNFHSPGKVGFELCSRPFRML